MRIHIVQKGETLWDIAKKYGVNFEQLKKMNAQLSNPEMIMPGMKIKIPSTGTAAKKEMPKSFSGSKEMPKAEHPYLPKKEKPIAVAKEKPKVVKEVPKEKPQTIYQPVMPEHQTLPEIDINNYYTFNLKKQKVQQQVQQQIQQPVSPPVQPKLKEEPVMESVEPVSEIPLKEEVAQPMLPTYTAPMTMPMPVPCFDPCYNPCFNPCFHPCYSSVHAFPAHMMPQYQGAMNPWGTQNMMPMATPSTLPGVPQTNVGYMQEGYDQEMNDDFMDSADQWMEETANMPAFDPTALYGGYQPVMPSTMAPAGGDCGCGGFQQHPSSFGWHPQFQQMTPWNYSLPQHPMGTAMPATYAMPNRYDEGSEDE